VSTGIIGVAIAAPIILIDTDLILHPQDVSPERIFNNSITPLSDAAYEVHVSRTIKGGFTFINGDNSLSFKPSKIGWDASPKKSLVGSVKREVISNGNEVNSREHRKIEGVKYLNIFGEGISVGILAYKDVFRKISKIDSLSNLGAIPEGAEFLELEFEISSSYQIPVGMIEENIKLGDNFVLRKSNAWDRVSEIDIESEIVDRNGQLFLIKRIPIEWLLSAQFPVYSDADILVENLVDEFTDVRNALWGPYWIDTQIAVIIFNDDGGDLSFARTTDGGVNWTTTQIFSGVSRQVASWFDQETPGDTGTLVHIAWLDTNGVDFAYYQTVDVSDSALGTRREVDNTVTVSTNSTQNRVAITKTVSGNLIYAFTTQADKETYRSTDGGVTWVDRADVYETPKQEDWVLLSTANTGDNDDAAAIFWDRSANELSIKMYDETANTWTETVIGDGVDNIFDIQMDVSVRHSDKHILFTHHSDVDTSSDDLLTFDLTVDSIASPTVTAKTNVFTNQVESAVVGIITNQQNDDVYISYFKGGTYVGEVDVVFHKSTDGMGSWGAEQAYSESAPDDFRNVDGGRTVGNDGGRIQWSFFDDDEVDIYVNLVNDIEIAAVAVGGTPGIPNWFQRGSSFIRGKTFVR